MTNINLHEYCKEHFNTFSDIMYEDDFICKRLPEMYEIRKIKFYSSEESYKARIPDYEGSCYGITLDPSNDNKICYMNIRNQWFNYISL